MIFVVVVYLLFAHMGDKPVHLCGRSVASEPLDRQGIICPGYRDQQRKETHRLSSLHPHTVGQRADSIVPPRVSGSWESPAPSPLDPSLRHQGGAKQGEAAFPQETRRLWLPISLHTPHQSPDAAPGGLGCPLHQKQC